MNKRKYLAVSLIALFVMVAMFVGVGNMTSQATKDLSVAVTKSDTGTVVATRATNEALAEQAVERAYSTAEEAFEAYDMDSLIAYERTVDPGYAKPLGESTTVWKSRSQDLAGVVAVEIISLGALAFVVVLIASRIIRRVVSSEK